MDHEETIEKIRELVQLGYNNAQIGRLLDMTGQRVGQIKKEEGIGTENGPSGAKGARNEKEIVINFNPEAKLTNQLSEMTSDEIQKYCVAVIKTIVAKYDITEWETKYNDHCMLHRELLDQIGEFEWFLEYKRIKYEGKLLINELELHRLRQFLKDVAESIGNDHFKLVESIRAEVREPKFDEYLRTLQYQEVLEVLDNRVRLMDGWEEAQVDPKWEW